jgi:hypothetical protein
MPAGQTPYNPVVRCHAGKAAGFVLAERNLTLPANSVKTAGYGPNGSRTSDPGVVGSHPTRPSKTVRLSSHRHSSLTSRLNGPISQVLASA